MTNELITPLVLLTTCPDQTCAEQLAERIIESRVAACVNILPKMMSVYRWNNQIEKSEEYLLLIKTTQTKYYELEQLIKSCHPYELPEIIAVPVIQGFNAYLAWIESEVNVP